MTTTNTIQTETFTRTRLIVVFVILLMSSIGMFGQNANVVNATAIEATQTIVSSDETNNTIVARVSENSNMNLFSWFMGTKQTPNSNMKNNDSNNIKKQMINSGTEPNRLLIKSFLKKASNYTEVVA